MNDTGEEKDKERKDKEKRGERKGSKEAGLCICLCFYRHVTVSNLTLKKAAERK